MAMKAPSPLCLRVLRSLAFPQPSTQRHRLPLQRRCYAALPDSEQRTSTPQPPPPPRTFKTPAPPADPQYEQHPSRSSTPAPTQPPSQPPARQRTAPPPPVFRPVPAGPDLRKKRDDDEDFTPLPLTRPIGMPEPPQPTDNIGLDTRTLRQRRDDFHNYEHHLAKRARMTRQIAKPYFRDWSNMRFFKGKVWVAPERLFRGDVALWFPNFFGRTLSRAAERRQGVKDGYGGLGRGTTEVLRGKISVVSIVSNEWATGQINTFCGKKENPDLHALIQEHEGIAQRVEINYENNFLKYWILRFFAVPKLRRSRTASEQERYFIVRRGVSEIMKEAIGLLNDKAGYVYLVDPECRIRWAGSAEASPRERRSLVEGVRRLVREAKGEVEPAPPPEERKEKLEAAVEEITGEALLPEAKEKTAAVG